MANCSFDDYTKFIGKYITVIYEYGSRTKRLHCTLLEYCKKGSREKYITLKAYNNIIYNINCDKVIFWTAEYKDMLIDNKDAYKPETEPIDTNTSLQSEGLPFSQPQAIETESSETLPLTLTPNIESNYEDSLQNKESISTSSVISYMENAAVASDENIDSEELQVNNDTHSELANNPDTTLVSMDNKAIVNDDPSINYIMADLEKRHDNVISDYKEVYDCDQVIEQSKKKDLQNKNEFYSPLVAFVNWNFKGVYLTFYTASDQVISGEVILNYDYLIVLKADGKTYYINPELVTYFY
jgi:hypothetical protein